MKDQRYELLLGGIVLGVAGTLIWHVFRGSKLPSSDSTQTARLSDDKFKLDELTDKFLTKKQQLSYFLITAAVVPIGFVAQVLKDREPVFEVSSLPWVALVVGGSIGILAAGSALLALRSEIMSYQIHIRYRHKGTLSTEERCNWDRVNWFGHLFRNCAFVLLMIELPLLAVSLVDFLTV